MDKPTRELLKPDVAALDVPTVKPLTLDESRKGSRAGETAAWMPDATFYKVGPLTAKANPPKVFIGGRAPDSDQEGGAYIVMPLPGARRQMVKPDDIKPGYDQQPGGF